MLNEDVVLLVARLFDSNIYLNRIFYLIKNMVVTHGGE